MLYKQYFAVIEKNACAVRTAGIATPKFCLVKTF